jgi:hypothetical protein
LFADIRKSSRPFVDDKTEDDFWQLDVSVAALTCRYLVSLRLYCEISINTTVVFISLLHDSIEWSCLCLHCVLFSFNFNHVQFCFI